MSETTKINSDMASSGQKHKSAGKKIVLIAVCVVIAAAIAGFLLFRDTVRLMTIRTAPDMFKFLAEDENRFDSRWESARKAISDKGITGEWDELCGTVSAAVDFLNDPDLSDTAGSLFFFRDNNTYLGDVLNTVEKGLSPKMQEAVYSSGHRLNLPGTVWVRSVLDQRMEGLEAPERQKGDPVRIVVADDSKVIPDRAKGIVNILDDGKLVSEYKDDVHNRDGSIYGELFRKSERTDRRWTAYPEEADVLLTITVNYPSAGQYAGNTGRAEVYSCVIILKAKNLHTGETKTEVFRKDPGNNITAAIGSTTVWMERPIISGKDDAIRLADTIMSWFPADE